MWNELQPNHLVSLENPFKMGTAHIQGTSKHTWRDVALSYLGM